MSSQKLKKSSKNSSINKIELIRRGHVFPNKKKMQQLARALIRSNSWKITPYSTAVCTYQKIEIYNTIVYKEQCNIETLDYTIKFQLNKEISNFFLMAHYLYDNLPYSNEDAQNLDKLNEKIRDFIKYLFY